MSIYSPQEAGIIAVLKEGHLYNHDFSQGDKVKGKFLSVVRSDNSEALIDVSPRIQLKIVYIYDKDEISGFEITKIKKSSSKSLVYEDTVEKIKLSNASLGDIVAFADFIKSLDLKGISERRIKLGDDSFDKIDEETKKKIKTALSTDDGKSLILEVLNQGVISSSDIINIGYRKSQLAVFGELLNKQEYWKKYADDEIDNGEKFDKSKEEKVWQHFFKKNPWIFGYGLDYKYLEILQTEAVVGGADVSGKNTENLDTLAGTSDYTVLIELKSPSTALFDNEKNRSNSWRLSRGLIWAVSQILEYKASHVIEWQDSSKRFNDNGSKISQSALDPKAILVIGRDSMMSEDDDKTNEIKRRTFELFCRDSRNIKILTYDELFRRAKFIVDNSETGNKK